MKIATIFEALILGLHKVDLKVKLITAHLNATP